MISITMLDDIAKYNREFEKEKQRVDKILAEGGNFPSDGEVDPEIRGLVYELNRLPFVYSRGSCSGHLVTREDIFRKAGHRDERLLQLPDEGCGFYFEGRLGLIFKPHPKKRECIRELGAVAGKYPPAYVADNYKPIIETDMEELQGLTLEIKFDNMIKIYPPIITLNKGAERRKAVNGLMRDLHGLFSAY